jgi:hypothetical protein
MLTPLKGGVKSIIAQILGGVNSMYKKRANRRLCILSGEIGGGSTEALICLGISVFVGL